MHVVLDQSSVFYFTFKGKVFVNFLPFQGLASLEKVKNIFYLFHQFIKNLKISEFRAKIKGKLLKTSNIKHNFRLRRAKSVKNNLNISISTKQKITARRATILFTFSEKQNKNTGPLAPGFDTDTT